MDEGTKVSVVGGVGCSDCELIALERAKYTFKETPVLNGTSSVRSHEPYTLCGSLNNSTEVSVPIHT